MEMSENWKVSVLLLSESIGSAEISVTRGAGPTDISIAELHFADDVAKKLAHSLVWVHRAASARLL